MVVVVVVIVDGCEVAVGLRFGGAWAMPNVSELHEAPAA